MNFTRIYLVSLTGSDYLTLEEVIKLCIVFNVSFKFIVIFILFIAKNGSALIHYGNFWLGGIDLMQMFHIKNANQSNWFESLERNKAKDLFISYQLFRCVYNSVLHHMEISLLQESIKYRSTNPTGVLAHRKLFPSVPFAVYPGTKLFLKSQSRDHS